MNSAYCPIDTIPDEMVLAICVAATQPVGNLAARGIVLTCRRLSAIALPIMRQSVKSLECLMPTGSQIASHAGRLFAVLSSYPLPAYVGISYGSWYDRYYGDIYHSEVCVYLGRLHASGEYRYVKVCAVENWRTTVYDNGICMTPTSVHDNFSDILARVACMARDAACDHLGNEDHKFESVWGNRAGIIGRRKTLLHVGFRGRCGIDCNSVGRIRFKNFKCPYTQVLRVGSNRTRRRAARRRNRQRKNPSCTQIASSGDAGAFDVLPNEIISIICEYVATPLGTFRGAALVLVCKHINVIATPILRNHAQNVRDNLTQFRSYEYLNRLFSVLGRYPLPVYCVFYEMPYGREHAWDECFTTYIGYNADDGRIAYVQINAISDGNVEICSMGNYWQTRLRASDNDIVATSVRLMRKITPNNLHPAEEGDTDCTIWSNRLGIVYEADGKSKFRARDRDIEHCKFDKIKSDCEYMDKIFAVDNL